MKKLLILAMAVGAIAVSGNAEASAFKSRQWSKCVSEKKVEFKCPTQEDIDNTRIVVKKKMLENKMKTCNAKVESTCDELHGMLGN